MAFPQISVLAGWKPLSAASRSSSPVAATSRPKILKHCAPTIPGKMHVPAADIPPRDPSLLIRDITQGDIHPAAAHPMERFRAVADRIDSFPGGVLGEVNLDRPGLAERETIFRASSVSGRTPTAIRIRSASSSRGP